MQQRRRTYGEACECYLQKVQTRCTLLDVIRTGSAQRKHLVRAGDDGVMAPRILSMQLQYLVAAGKADFEGATSLVMAGWWTG